MEKLVRDLIPEVMQKNGNSGTFRTATSQEYPSKLIEKFQEEVQEFVSEPSIEEYVDILDVLEALRINYNFNPVEIDQIRKEKQLSRGLFNKKILMSKP